LLVRKSDVMTKGKGLQPRDISTVEMRSKYLNFFKERGHAIIPSASLIPDGDGSVLFTTAGMHPLVPYFLGREHACGTRLVNCQKCVRTNDIEEVGDLTHLTFFEMLGNWSLGDYYKHDSIRWSYEFLTREDLLAIPQDLIWVTVFEGNQYAPRDEESAGIWRALGIPEDRIIFLGVEDNWWAAGSEGPCGPDTEIFIDRTGEPCTKGTASCKPGTCKCGRFFEVWNNVFMSYERRGDQVFDLPRKNVDTGMGLERTLAVLNGVESVYETTSFRPIINRIIEASGHTEEEIYAEPKLRKALRVLADHIRTSTFIIGDELGVKPSKQGQGYVLRRLIRRAIRYCEALDVKPENWVAISDVVISEYGDQYPELKANRESIHSELRLEKDRFKKTLSNGIKLITKEIERLHSAGQNVLEGEVAFRLYDTYGFPIEFTNEILEEHGLNVDMDRFLTSLTEHQEKSKSESAKSGLADDSEESIKYHTVTHLLHTALRCVLGDTVHQKGSNINRERMRFDFTFERPMTSDEIKQVQNLVQKWIDADLPVERTVMSLDDARASGAIGLFNDRYGEEVSVYQIGDVSLEFCGGPHVNRTSEIGRFEIKKEQSSSAGVRRIRAQIS
jgi:alanyl-tRNA synthetase